MNMEDTERQQRARAHYIISAAKNTVTQYVKFPLNGYPPRRSTLGFGLMITEDRKSRVETCHPLQSGEKEGEWVEEERNWWKIWEAEDWRKGILLVLDTL